MWTVWFRWKITKTPSFFPTWYTYSEPYNYSLSDELDSGIWSRNSLNKDPKVEKLTLFFIMHCVILHTNINFKTQQEFFPLFLLLLILGEYLHTTRWLNLPYARKIKLNWAKWTPTNAWKYSHLFHLEKTCKKYFVRTQFYVLKSFSPPPSPPNKESCRPQLCCQCTGISWCPLGVFCCHGACHSESILRLNQYVLFSVHQWMTLTLSTGSVLC